MVSSVKLQVMSLMRPPKLGVETVMALAGTAFSAMLLVVTARHAGPLWRDEVNTLNVAQMPTLGELWHNQLFESFPPLWPLVVRGSSVLGLTGSDAGIRALGLCVGLFFLSSLWLCSRWMGGRAPILSVAVLGSLPAFLFTVGENRAYGLASGLLVLSFGMIWRMVESPAGAQIFLAVLACLLFAHCRYEDAVFLGALLAGAAMVAIRRRRWKALGALAGIGAVSGASMFIYLPIIRRGWAYVPMIRNPFFEASTIWRGFCDALGTRSSAQAGAGPVGPEVVLWVMLLMGGSVVALIMQPAWGRQARNQQTAAATTARIRADLALFCVVSMLLGIVGFFAFWLKVQYFMQKWYFLGILSLCAISLDGILSANWPALRPWGLLRMGLLVVMITWSARSAWEETHTRRSNVDLIAAELGQKASAEDLIVVHSPWEGITFDRYYHGHARWVTVPPMDSHEVHRNDLALEILEQLSQRNPMVPVLNEVTDTLRSGHSVWLVGHATVVYPNPVPLLPPPPALPTKWWLGSYFENWSAQVTTHLLVHAQRGQVLKIPVNQPVNWLENLPVTRFSGYRSDAN